MDKREDGFKEKIKKLERFSEELKNQKENLEKEVQDLKSIERKNSLDFDVD